MTGDDEAFLRAIIAAPDDDLPRLIYADYLDGDGPNDCKPPQPERAEFIRVQCELAPSESKPDPFNNDRLVALRRRERELQHLPVSVRCEWHSPIPHGGFKWKYRRGFVEEITCSWEDWQTHADAIRSSTPLRTVRLTTWPDESLYEPFSAQWPEITFEPMTSWPLAPDRSIEVCVRELDVARQVHNALAVHTAQFDFQADITTRHDPSERFTELLITVAIGTGTSGRAYRSTYRFRDALFVAAGSPQAVVDIVQSGARQAIEHLVRQVRLGERRVDAAAAIR